MALCQLFYLTTATMTCKALQDLQEEGMDSVILAPESKHMAR